MRASLMLWLLDKLRFATKYFYSMDHAWTAFGAKNLFVFESDTKFFFVCVPASVVYIFIFLLLFIFEMKFGRSLPLPQPSATMKRHIRANKRERERNSWPDAKETLTYTRQRRHCSRVGQTLFPKNATFLRSFAFFSKMQHSQVLLHSL